MGNNFARPCHAMQMCCKLTKHMMNKESDKFREALASQQFSEHDIKIILVVLEGEGNYNQEDIIDFSEKNKNTLKKLGWLRKVKKAIKDAGLHLKNKQHTIISDYNPNRLNS